MNIWPRKYRQITLQVESFKKALVKKSVALLPPMRRSNQHDMPLVTRNHFWFLHENRFLFFTQNGPIEITVKPAVVLTVSLIGMVGVSVIFLSTIFASYSAIEVMRDESIQTAEASISSPDRDISTKQKNSTKSKSSTWDLETEGRIVKPNSNNALLSKYKIARTPIPVVSLFGAKSSIRSPMPPHSLGEEYSTVMSPLPQMKDTTNYNATPVPNIIINNASTDSSAGKKSVVPFDGPKTEVTLDETVLTNSLARHNDKKIINAVPDQMFITSLIDETYSGTSTESKTHATTAFADEQPNFAKTAAGFAIAMLPRFLTKPDQASSISNEPEKPAVENKSEPEVVENSFATIGRGGPLIPSISKEARARKMLLSLNNEISYIRQSIVNLGISSDSLPRYTVLKTADGKTDFKQLLITLAEHRAALRKIPFKPPMLYFYISSNYGMRKHPKTGKKTFHHGIDLAGTWQENVRATAPGTVVYAGREGSFGKVVRIDHDYGVSTLYAHLARITVSVGDYVGENTVIGKMGNTGKSAGAHLHYEVQVSGRSVDPSEFFIIGREISVAGELRQTSLTE